MSHPDLDPAILEAAAKRRGRPHVYDEIVPSRTALVVIDLQNAFMRPGASTLPAMLRGRGIDTVLIAGCMTNMCCDSSARDAVMTDFRTVMVSDCNAARTDAEHLSALASFLTGFGDVRRSDDLITAFAHVTAVRRAAE